VARSTTGARWPTVAVVLVLLLVAGAGGGAYALGWVDYWRGTDQAPPATPAAPPAAAAVTPGDAEVAAPADGAQLRKSAVLRALAEPLRDKRFGGRLAAWVAPLSGAPVVRRGDWLSMPASTTKLLTAAAALETYEPDHRFATEVRRQGRTVTLVGGGDPLLSSADVGRLARAAAARLQRAGVDRVSVGYDPSLFAQPSISPRWRATYVPEETVPITPLVVDRGHLAGADGRLDTYDDSYTMRPAVRAAQVFSQALARAGIRVQGSPAKRTGGGTVLASHDSDPLSAIVEHTLKRSDNLAAEFLARHVGLAAGDGSFTGGTRAVEAALVDLGLPGDGVDLRDGSGLSRDDRIAAPVLLSALQLAASPDHPELRPLVTGLPVAGFDGSLLARFYDDAEPARGYVRAKTGTLTGAHALAGIVTDRRDTPMVVVLLADRVSDAGSLDARDALDDAMARLAACVCS